MSSSNPDNRQREALNRIAGSNVPVAAGSGFDTNHFVPVCKIVNRALATRFHRELADQNISVRIHRDRLCSQFFVGREHISAARSVHQALLASQPDTQPRRFSHDYDAVFLISPLVILTAIVAYWSPWIPKHAWIAVIVSGASMIVLLERINRQYRLQLGMQWNLRDLFWITVGLAINLAVWRTLALILLMVMGSLSGLRADEIELPSAPLERIPPGLKVTSKFYPDFSAVEWQLRLRDDTNSGQTVFADIRSADFQVAFPKTASVELHWIKGSHAEASDFQPYSQLLVDDKPIRLESFGGRSSDGVMPYFNLAGSNGGLIMAIGWSGDWQATFTRDSNNRVRVTAGLKRTHFKLPAGEEVRLPSILMMTYRGSWVKGQNQFRKLMLNHLTPANHPPLRLMPVAASVHGMFGFNDTDEAKLIDLARDIGALKLPVDTYWLDAGWNQGGFPAGQGNPQPDPVRFPNGLKPVSDAARQAGLRFLAWFEPERAMRDTWLSRQHPDWLLQPSQTPHELRYMENDGFRLVDLGNKAARQWAIEMCSEHIREANIQIYRQDFNQYPAYFWHTQEKPDEIGLREIRYITGLYTFLDTLVERHPDLILDHCASGGRRQDFEILRRCVSLWRSDSCWDDARYPRNVQCMTHGLSQWLPLHGLGSVSTGDIGMRSGMGACASFAINYRDSASVAALRQHLERYLPIRHLYMADYYPLTEWSDDTQQWIAFQFIDGAQGKGVVQAFRGAGGNNQPTTLKLQGLEPTATYAITDWDSTAELMPRTGKELMTGGLSLPPSTEPQAKVIQLQRQ